MDDIKKKITEIIMATGYAKRVASHDDRSIEMEDWEEGLSFADRVLKSWRASLRHKVTGAEKHGRKIGSY